MTLAQMRLQKDKGLLDKLPGLNAWWEQWQRVTPDVVSLMYNKPEFREEIQAIFTDAGEPLKDVDAVIDPGLLEHITNALEIAAEEGSGSVSAHAKRAYNVIANLDQPTSRVLFERLSKSRPAS
jgi:hypothetical protein